MSTMGQMSIIVGVTTVGTQRAVREIQLLEATVHKAQVTMLSAGRAMTQFLSLPAGLIAGAAVKVFSDFEYSLAKITGLVGIAKEQTEAWGQEILGLSSKVAKGPKELVDALYFITSSGFKTSESMRILEMSAKAASAGLGETKNVADIVTSAMNAYGKGSITAASAVDVLTMAVREGKGEAPEMVQAFATSIPIAAKLGVSFDQVGGAIAAMTRMGISAATASTYLRQSLFTLLKPSKKTREGLADIGLTAQQVRDSLENNGLLDTFIMLNEKTKNLSEEGLAEIFPNIRAFMAITSLVNENLSDTIGVFDNVKNSLGVTDKAFQTVSETMKFKWNAAMAEGETLLINFGESVGKRLIPAVEKLLQIFTNLNTWWVNLSDSAKYFILNIGGVVIALGPAMLIFRGMKAFISSIITGFKLLGDAIGKVITALRTFTVTYSGVAASANKAVILAQTNAVAGVKNIIAAENAYVAAQTQSGLAEANRALALDKLNKLRKAAAVAEANYAGIVTVVRGREIYSTEKIAEATRYYTGAKLSLAKAQKAYAAGTGTAMAVQIAANRVMQTSTVLTAARVAASKTAILAYEEMIIANTAVANQEVISEEAVIAAKRADTKVRILKTLVTKAERDAILLEIEAERLQAEATIANANAGKKAGLSFAALGKSMSKIPFGVIAALAAAAIYGLVKLVTKLSEAEKAERELRAKVAESISGEVGQIQSLIAVARNEYLSKAERIDAIKKLNEISPVYLGNLRLETINTEQATTAIDTYLSSMERKAKVQQATLLYEEKSAQYNKAAIEGAEAQLKFWGNLQAVLVGTSNKFNPIIVALSSIMGITTKSTKELLMSLGQKKLDKYLSDLQEAEKLLKKIAEDRTPIIQGFKDDVALNTIQTNDLISKYSLLRSEKKSLSKETYVKKESELNKELVKGLDLLNNIHNGIKEREKLEKDLFRTDKELNDARVEMFHATSIEEYGIAAWKYQARINFIQKENKESKKLYDEQYNNAISNYNKLNKLYTDWKGVPYKLGYKEPEKTTTTDREPTKLEQLQKDLNESLKEYTILLDIVDRNAQDYGTTTGINAEKAEKLKEILGLKNEVLARGGKIEEQSIGTVQALYTAFSRLATGEEAWSKALEDFGQSNLEVFNDIEQISMGYKSATEIALDVSQQLGKDLTDLSTIAKNSGSAFNETEGKIELYSAALSTLHSLLKKANKEGDDFSTILQLIQDLSFTKDKLANVTDYTDSISSLNEKMKLLGKSSEFLEDKLSLLREQLREKRNANISIFNDDQKKQWVKDVNTFRTQIETLQGTIAILDSIKQGIADVFTGLAESVGASLAGVKDSFKSLLDVVIEIYKTIGRLIIGVGSALLFINPGLGAALIAAGSVMTGAASYASSRRAKKQEAEEAAKNNIKGMAQGGIVPAGYPNDSYPAKLTSGEMVIPPMKLPEFERQAIDVNVTVEGKTKGQDLYYVIKEVERRYKNAY